MAYRIYKIYNNVEKNLYVNKFDYEISKIPSKATKFPGTVNKAACYLKKVTFSVVPKLFKFLLSSVLSFLYIGFLYKKLFFLMKY